MTKNEISNNETKKLASGILRRSRHLFRHSSFVSLFEISSFVISFPPFPAVQPRRREDTFLKILATLGLVA